jgi:hypothetical protein
MDRSSDLELADGQAEPARDAAQEVSTDAQAGTDDASSGDASSLDDADPTHPDDFCNNDAHEPDDSVTQTEAHDALSGIQPIGIVDLVACPGESDYFWGGRVDAGGSAGAVLTWDASLGELGLSMGNADNMSVTLDVDETTPGRAAVRIAEYYDYYFYVTVTNASNVAIPYELTLTAQVFGP